MEQCPSVRFEPSMSGSLFDTYLVKKIVQVHDFVPDLQVGRVMPVVNGYTTLLLCRQRMKSLITVRKVGRFVPVVISELFLFYRQKMKSFVITEANLRTNLSSLLISFESLLLTLTYFYEIQMTFPESASTTFSHIQSTAKYIFLRAP